MDLKESDRGRAYRPEVESPGEVPDALVSHAERSLRDMLRRLNQADTADQGPPTPLYVCDSEWAYRQTLDGLVGPGAGRVSGGSSGVFFVPDREAAVPGLALFTRDAAVFDLMTTVQHECFHHAAYLAFGNGLPRWLNEGLAQYFQDAVFHRGRLRLGLADSDRLERLQRQAHAGPHHIPGLRELIETPDAAWFAGPGWSVHDVSRLYAGAWLVVLTLTVGPVPELCRAFAQYLGAMRHTAGDHDAAWHATLGRVDPDTIDAAARSCLADFRPEGVCGAIRSLSLLAQVLGVFNHEGLRMPASLDEARHRMRLLGVELYRRVPGAEPVRHRGDNETLYCYEIEPGLSTEVELGPPEQPMHPPTLRAPGVRGDPRVRWVGRGRRVVPWLEFSDE